MQNTTYVGISKMTALSRQMDIVANNIANSDTTAFKSDDVMFREFVQKIRHGDDVSFVEDHATKINFDSGSLEQTDRALDVALEGDGFFVVDTPQGERYTRNGSFTVGDDGTLRTTEGYTVYSQFRDPIDLPDNAEEIKIMENGSIYVDGNQIGELGVALFPNNQELTRVAGGLFKADEIPQQIEMPPDGSGPTMHQGMLEGSNVNPIQEMARMIRIHREFEGATQLIEGEHERMRRMVQTLLEVN